MANNIKENKPMPKWLIYGLFVLKFLIGLYLIYWTVYMTFQSDVGQDEDNAFLSTYHSVDADFNKRAKENKKFEKNYNIKFVINDKEIIGLTYKDIYLSQRAMLDKKERKNILKVGENNFAIQIQNKNGDKVNAKLIDILITKSTNHHEDVKLKLTDDKQETFIIKSKGFWNITGIVEVENHKGSFYIKTSAK